MESDIPYEILIPYEVPVPVPVHDPDLIAELDRLRAELAAMQKQRDEARENLRDACTKIARSESYSWVKVSPEEVAKAEGWDCYDQITETGITKTDIDEADINNQSFRERKLD